MYLLKIFDAVPIEISDIFFNHDSTRLIEVLQYPIFKPNVEYAARLLVLLVAPVLFNRILPSPFDKCCCGCGCNGGEETKAKFGGDITGVNFALPLLPASLLRLPPSELENELRISIAFCAFTAEAMSTVELVDGVSIIFFVNYPLLIFGLLVLPSKTSVELFSCSEELPLPPPLPPIMLTIGGRLAKSCEPSVWLK
uniref:Uncharacterized protein n=1 Tax=Glossina austeni TaxID=7395 RepID=A0A1A9UNV1_GLOAU